MKIRYPLLCAGILITAFISCKKDGGSSSSDIEGTWNFSGIHSETKATVLTTGDGFSGKDVTLSTYDSKNNVGTVKFSGGTITSTGLGYAVDTSTINYDYQDDVLVDSFSFPLQLVVQPTSSTSNYKLVGKDSISFTGTGLVGNAQNTNTASGGHYTIAGNKLVLTTSFVKDSAANDGSTSYSLHETADVKIYLEK